MENIGDLVVYLFLGIMAILVLFVIVWGLSAWIDGVLIRRNDRRVDAYMASVYRTAATRARRRR